MFNKKGGISALVILGTIVVMGIAAVMSSTVNNQRQVTDTRAAAVSCRNNPVSPPDGGYTWVANCSSSCTTNADCPQNTSDPSNVNPATSNWCYQFAEGAKCIQLQKGSSNITPSTPNPTSNPTNPGNTSGAVCTVATGCGGACNSNFNQGCGYGGCRAWEDCVNNTCIDTTNLGTQPAGANACHGLASADSPGNTVPTSGQAPSTPPQSTTVPQNPTQTQPTQVVLSTNPTTIPSQSPTPRTSCRPGQIRCIGSDVCVDSQEFCPPTPTAIIVNNGLPVPPLPSQAFKKVKVVSDKTAKACIGDPFIDDGCIDILGFYKNYNNR